MFIYNIAGMSEAGLKKKENQDYFEYFPLSIKKAGDTYVLVLADGMGGASGGKIASTLAITEFKQSMEKSYDNNIRKLLSKAFQEANESVLKTGTQNKDLTGMGTTMTAAVLYKKKLWTANIGDSRCYLIQNDKIVQLTTDHSYVYELLSAGKITALEAESHPDRNVITKAIGIEKQIEPDIGDYLFKSLDRQYLLLCSDGLHKQVSSTDIIYYIRKYENPAEICKNLIDAANQSGGPDNITVLIAQIIKKNMFKQRIFNWIYSRKIKK
jgi:protein phosphatase